MPWLRLIPNSLQCMEIPYFYSATGAPEMGLKSVTVTDVGRLRGPVPPVLGWYRRLQPVACISAATRSTSRQTRSRLPLHSFWMSSSL